MITTPQDDTTYTATYVPSAAVHREVLRQHDLLGSAGADQAGPERSTSRGGRARPIRRCPSTASRCAGPRRSGSAPAGTGSPTVADDGVRLYIDGRRVIDQWQGPANTEFDYVADLGEGKHTIKMEYVEYGGDATGVAQLGQRAGPAVRHLPGRVLERAAGRQRDPEHDAGAGARRGGDRPRLGRGLAGSRHRAEPVRGALDAHDELRPRRLRVRRHRRRRRPAVRRRRAG